MHCSGVSRRVIVCVECSAMSATPSVRGWRGYRTDDPELEEAPELVFYCPVCAVAEFGQRLPRPTGNRSRRFRDARRPSPMLFRVAVDTALALAVADVGSHVGFRRSSRRWRV